jgi:hypothetical protein
VTGRGGLWDREMSRLPHFLDNWLTDSGNVSRAGRPRFIPQKHLLVLISVEGEATLRAIVQLEGLGKLDKFNDLIETRTRDLPDCSIAPQPTTLPCGCLNSSVC